MPSTADDRRKNAYELATTLSQDMLDETFLGGENQIEAVGILTKTLSGVFTVTLASPAVFTSPDQGLVNGDPVALTTTGALYTGLTAGGTYYLINKSGTTFNLSATVGGTAINTSGTQSGVHMWTRTWTIRFADRPKFVGNDFYEGRASFPQVKKTIGDLLAPTLQFSQFEVVLANMDGFYNAYLTSGVSYFSFIGSVLQIKIGLRDVAASFLTIFTGIVPDQGGFTVARESITIRANDRFDELNIKPNLPFINDTDFPSAPTDVLGKVIPFVLGDWSVGFNVNTYQSQISVDDGFGVQTYVKVASPNSFYGGVIGYYVGGGGFVFSIGSYTPDNATAIYIKRGDALMHCNSTLTPANTAGYWSIGVSSLANIDGIALTPYAYQSGDVAVINIKVPYTGTSYSNIIQIAQEILVTLGGLTYATDFDSTSWAALKAKSSPASADFTTIKARVWIGANDKNILEIVLSLLEQVRVEMFVDRNNMIALRALHPDEFTAQADLVRIEQVEINEESATSKADELTFFNQAQINYGFTSITDKTMLTTGQKANLTSISKSGKRVIKGIDCPNLYVEADVLYQLIEFLRFYSTGLTFIEAEVCWVHLLRELGSLVGLNYSIGSIDYANAPMQIRDYAINLANGSILLKLLSFANFPYTGYAPSNSARFLSSAAQSIEDVT
jgi:hypothetical protein